MSLAHLERARSAIGRNIKYGLGWGGRNPAKSHPGQWGVRKFVPGWYCDCSGFVAWVLGRSRLPSADWQEWIGGKLVRWWFSTDSVHRDATGPQQLFWRVPAGQERPGDIVVYPDYRGPDGKKHEGHIAIVADPARHLVVDCGSSSGGITERRVSVMWNRPKTVFCRLQGDV